MARQVLLDLSFRLDDEAQVDPIAGETRGDADHERARVPQRVEERDPVAELAEAGLRPREVLLFLARGLRELPLGVRVACDERLRGVERLRADFAGMVDRIIPPALRRSSGVRSASGRAAPGTGRRSGEARERSQRAVEADDEVRPARAHRTRRACACTCLAPRANGKSRFITGLRLPCCWLDSAPAAARVALRAPEGRKRALLRVPGADAAGKPTPTASTPPMTDGATHGRPQATLTAAVDSWCPCDTEPTPCSQVVTARVAHGAFCVHLATVSARREPPGAGACAAVGVARAARDRPVVMTGCPFVLPSKCQLVVNGSVPTAKEEASP